MGRGMNLSLRDALLPYLPELEADSIQTDSVKLDLVSSVFCFPFEVFWLDDFY